MPKKILPQEEEEFEEDYEDEEDEEEEPVAPPVSRGRPRKVASPSHARPKVPALPPLPKPRYSWVVQPAAEGLIDTESGEVIAQDEKQALADLKCQLDRIENAIGVMSG